MGIEWAGLPPLSAETRYWDGGYGHSFCLMADSSGSAEGFLYRILADRPILNVLRGENASLWRAPIDRDGFYMDFLRPLRTFLFHVKQKTRVRLRFWRIFLAFLHCFLKLYCIFCGIVLSGRKMGLYKRFLASFLPLLEQFSLADTRVPLFWGVRNELLGLLRWFFASNTEFSRSFGR